MSTLTAVMLENKLDMARRESAGRVAGSRATVAAQRPALALHWAVNPETGRPEPVWTAVRRTAPVPGLVLA